MTGKHTMKTYIIEDKIINIKTNETLVYYIGKDDFVHSLIECCEGYTKPSYAMNKIERLMADNMNMKKLDDMHGLENNVWLHIHNIIEYTKGE